MKRDCQHPRANHQHGTAIAYTHDACRCPDCTEAHRQNAANTGTPRACITEGRRIPGSGGHAHVVVIEAPAVPTQTRAYHH
jgi:hypothetical protein